MFKYAKTTVIIALLSGCSHLPKEGSEPKLTSNLDINSTKINGFDIRKHTKADLRVVKMIHVDRPAAQTFKLLVNTMPKWSQDLESVTYFKNQQKIGQTSNSTATHRECVFQGDLITESIPGYQEGSLFAYSIDPSRSNLGFPIENHLAVITVEDDTKGGSLVTWRQYYDRKLHVMAPFVTFFIDGLLDDSMQGFVKLYGGKQIEPVL